MKPIFTLFLVITCLNLSAQWSDTNNKFYDSLHMPVCTAAGDQMKSIVVQSYPDSGYFVIWEDHRKGFYENIQIFAQKYDKTGKQLWADNGVAISEGTNSQHFTVSSNNDYRKYSVAATDSTGGFYICYTDDSVSSYVWERLSVQHVRNDATKVFAGAGSILITSDQANQHLAPQLIADGNNGFFVGYLKEGYGTMDLFIYCYKEINGILKKYGGGLMDINGTTVFHTGNCGGYTTVENFQTYVIDYKIYPDLQKGCNLVMTFSQNGGVSNTNERMQTAFNWLWRVKKDVDVNGTHYPKDSVVLFYNFQQENGDLTCLVGKDVYQYKTSSLISLGFNPISNWVYGAEHANGVLVETDGNINVNICAVNQRDVNDDGATDWITRFFFREQEKFDDIPYEFKVSPFKPRNMAVGGPPSPPGQNKVGYENKTLSDTLMYSPGASYYYDFSLASGGNKVFATAIIGYSPKNVLLQQLKVQRISADSFAVQLNTASNKGVVIGKEVSTGPPGYPANVISYNTPQVVVNTNGNGLFYIMEMGRSTRVSPIFNGAELAWGAMGKPTGSGRFNNSRYLDNNSNSAITIDPVNGRGLLSWNDIRTPPSTANNIYMRHLDNLNVMDYLPVNNLVKQLINPYGAISANPAALLGSSKKFTTIEAYSGYSGYDVTTPVVEILDNYNLGSVAVSLYENTGAIRKYNGHPYLDRNYTITPENNPAGAATINVRLFFTQAEFDALKVADPSITSPADLAVVKQPATGSAPASYIFVAGEEQVLPQSWAAVPGGYYIEIAIKSFSNFFIQKLNGALPLQWLDVQAQWINNEAKITWQVAQQVNVKDYTVQQSLDGTNFVNVCNVAANTATTYSCIVPTTPNVVNYYRVQQFDIDGRSSFSKIVTLKSSSSHSVIIYPNPAKNNLFIRSDLNYRNLVITDLAGKVMLKKSISSGLNRIEIDQIPAGSYFIRLSGGDKTETLKFVKD